jgi:hypothetical protein
MTGKLTSALIDFGRSDLEGKLKRGAAGGRRRIHGRSARPRQGQRVVADPILDPARRELSHEREAKDIVLETTHRGHVTPEDDGVVDGSNGLKWRAPFRFVHDGLVDARILGGKEYGPFDWRSPLF